MKKCLISYLFVHILSTCPDVFRDDGWDVKMLEEVHWRACREATKRGFIESHFISCYHLSCGLYEYYGQH
jgi:hypothetical protein